jgi:phosphorylcholine metabolism protein LicD
MAQKVGQHHIRTSFAQLKHYKIEKFAKINLKFSKAVAASLSSECSVYACLLKKYSVPSHEFEKYIYRKIESQMEKGGMYEVTDSRNDKIIGCFGLNPHGDQS